MLRRDAGQPQARPFERVVQNRNICGRTKAKDLALSGGENRPFIHDDIGKTWAFARESLFLKDGESGLLANGQRVRANLKNLVFPV